MKVISPNDSTHTISLIPRFNEVTNITMFVMNETTKVETTGGLIRYTLVNGIGSAEFTLTAADKDKYSFKLVWNGTEIIYRGKMIATTQETQDYKLTTGLYFYE